MGVGPAALPPSGSVRVVLQRVSGASVTIAGQVVGQIGRGFLVLVGFTRSDGPAAIDWMADKIIGLRLFPDDDGKMNRSLGEAAGALLVVSQFTLYGDARKGRRPSFVDAAPPEHAVPCYERFVTVETGTFGAMMEVALVNDGPVTLVLER
jgi:D-tyrosyl-tRNA(Tyr) deacylase